MIIWIKLKEENGIIYINYSYNFLYEILWKEVVTLENKLKIITEKCPQNHKCPAVSVCPVGALSQNGFGAPIIDHDKCIRCGKCSNFCPKKALVLEFLH